MIDNLEYGTQGAKEQGQNANTPHTAHQTFKPESRFDVIDFDSLDWMLPDDLKPGTGGALPNEKDLSARTSYNSQRHDSLSQPLFDVDYVYPCAAGPYRPASPPSIQAFATGPTRRPHGEKQHHNL